MEKEKMKLWKKILIVVLVLFAIFIILTARKFIIITRLVNVSKEYENKTNYLAITSYVKGNMMYMRNSYNKDGNFLTETEYYGKSLDSPVISTAYKNGEEKIEINQRGENKTIKYELMSEVKEPIASVYGSFGDITIENLKTAIKSRITTDDYNGKECYLIKEKGRTLWVNKDTGIVYRIINGGFGLKEFVYEFDRVNDSDIVKPSI